jgi:hypothetical protein
MTKASIPIGVAAFTLLLTLFALIATSDRDEAFQNGIHQLPARTDVGQRSIFSDSRAVRASGGGELADFELLMKLMGESNFADPYPAVATKDFSEAQKLKILESIVEHLLTSDYMASSREFYGEGSMAAGLMDSEALEWPENFPKRVGGYELLRMSEESPENLERKAPFLLIQFASFLSPNDPWGPIEGVLLPFEGPMIATVSHYHAHDADTVKQGGCFVGYVPALEGKTWIARAKWAKDP